MDLTNFTATFNYASNKASRNIGSANKINTIRGRLKRSIESSRPISDKDARKKVTDFVRKNREEYPQQAKALHEILSRPDEAYDVGKAKINPHIDIPSQYTYSSGRMNTIDKIITESNSTSKAAKTATKAAGEGAAEAAKTAGKEAAEKVAKKSAEGLWDLAKKNKVPQIALGVAATAWLVNKLSDSRGQQSNAQLYGQQGY